MRLSTDSTAFVLLLAFLTMIGPISTDIFLPSLPSMAVTFGTSAAGVQATLTSFFIGFALAQLVHGPVADRVGRRPVLVAGLGLYTVASFFCVIAPTIEALVAARFVQAVTAAAPIILARTIVRDLHSGARAGQLLSVMASIMGVVPIVAPVIGGFFGSRFGWQSSFIAMTVIGAAGFAVVALLLPETVPERRQERLTPRSIFRSYAVVARSPLFRVYAAIMCLTYAGLILYIGTSAFIVQDRYHLSPVAYGLTFSTGAAAFIVGTFLGRRIVRHRTLDQTVGVGTVFLAIGGVLMPLCVAFGPGHVAEFALPVAVYMVGVGIVTPQTLAAAITPFPERAGAASSLLGFLHMGLGAIVLWATGVVFPDNAIANVVVLGATGLAAVLVYVGAARVRSA
jgi:DHA1 family bicyclomycin/chloramphenicol resistance-like MFS transporter